MQSLKILKSTEDGLKIDTEAFKPVLQKVGDRKFVVYSINGATRTGKSYVLNYFIRYFESRKKNRDNSNWINFHTDAMFIARGGRERETEGIHLWPEPYFVKTEDGEEIAVLLMDTQGLFDEKTTALQNAFIMSVSTLCSSVMIFNAMRLLNEDVLQQLQLYSNYASTVMNQDEDAQVIVTVNDESSASIEMDLEANKKSCQELFFLLRDFELMEYGFGIHGENKKPEDSTRNFFEDTFKIENRSEDECPVENKLVRKNILSNYKQVSVCTLPDPGKKFKRQAGVGAIEPDDDFKEHLQAFVEFLATKKLLRKQFGEVQVTGNEFLQYIKKWAEECEKSTKDKFPDVKTMAESTAWTQYSIAQNVAFTSYKEQMHQFMTNEKNKAGVPPDQLEQQQLVATNDSLKLFNRQRKIQNKNFDLEFENKLVNNMQHFLKNLKALNQKRLEYDEYRCQIETLNTLHKELVEGVDDMLSEMTDGMRISPDTSIRETMKIKTDKILRVHLGLNDDINKMKQEIERLQAEKTELIKKKSRCVIA